MDLGRYVACICEGSAEHAIIDVLLDNNKLIFNRDDMLEREVIRTRGKNFEKRYLRKDFLNKITILRILDSRREEFRLSKAYQDKVDVINIITAPEIEMLIILNEGKYVQYKKTKEKPSDFCKKYLGYKDVKNNDWVKEYFGNVDILINAIQEYKRISKIKNGEYTLCDLLK